MKWRGRRVNGGFEGVYDYKEVRIKNETTMLLSLDHFLYFEMFWSFLLFRLE